MISVRLVALSIAILSIAACTPRETSRDFVGEASGTKISYEEDELNKFVEQNVVPVLALELEVTEEAVQLSGAEIGFGVVETYRGPTRHELVIRSSRENLVVNETVVPISFLQHKEGKGVERYKESVVTVALPINGPIDTISVGSKERDTPANFDVGLVFEKACLVEKSAPYCD